MTDPDAVIICDHDPRWMDDFHSEAARILDVMGPLALHIQHVGSTAVPGLAAKPVIDILVAVEDLQQREKFVRLLDPLGYTNVPHDDPGRLFFRKGMPRTHHLHLVKERSWDYWKHVMFRDYLIDHPSAAEEYECLKRLLVSKHSTERERYVEGKTDLIELILQRAVREQVQLRQD